MVTPIGAILVGIDGSADADKTLEWAGREAESRRAPLHLMYALPQPLSDLPFPEAEVREHIKEGKRVLSDARAQLARWECEATTDMVDAPAARALLAAAATAQMLVVGARGHGAVSGYLLGSVSQDVARHAPCPVVVIRHQADLGATRIVVGVDASPSSAKAIGFAFEEAARHDAPLVAIHAWAEPAHHGGVGTTQPTIARTAERAVVGERLIAEALAGWSEQFPDVKVTSEAIPTHPATVLAAASEHASLVVVGSRGRGAVTGMLLGSVSQAVLHHAKCLVAVVR